MKRLFLIFLVFGSFTIYANSHNHWGVQIGKEGAPESLPLAFFELESAEVKQPNRSLLRFWHTDLYHLEVRGNDVGCLIEKGQLSAAGYGSLQEAVDLASTLREGRLTLICNYPDFNDQTMNLGELESITLIENARRDGLK
jgi:hypothetical protein